MRVPGGVTNVVLYTVLDSAMVFGSPAYAATSVGYIRTLTRVTKVRSFGRLNVSVFEIGSTMRNATVHSLIVHSFGSFGVGNRLINVNRLRIVSLSMFSSVGRRLRTSVTTVGTRNGHRAVVLLLASVVGRNSRLLIVDSGTRLARGTCNGTARGNHI